VREINSLLGVGRCKEAAVMAEEEFDAFEA
jgi:hypothetical protein